MKNLLILPLLLLSILSLGQKSSITIKAGYTSSSIDNPLFSSQKFTEIGVGYTYKFSNMLWISAEPGLKTAGYRTTKTSRTASIYFNTPIIGTFNIGANKLIAAIDAGYAPSFKIAGGNTPNSFSEVLFGARMGYKISPRFSMELYYRYGESVSKFAYNKPLTSNYISLQARISLGKN